MRRPITLLAAVAFIAAAAGGPPVATPAAMASDRCDGVWVVVDARDAGGPVTARCAPGDPSSGIRALQEAGHRVGYVPNQPGFVCTLDARPDPCNGAPASAYWSYWHAPAGGAWSYSNAGAGNRDPAPGTVEGWRFGDGSAPPRLDPPTNPEPAPAPAPAPEPAPEAAEGSGTAPAPGANDATSGDAATGDARSGAPASSNDPGSEPEGGTDGSGPRADATDDARSGDTSRAPAASEPLTDAAAGNGGDTADGDAGGDTADGDAGGDTASSPDDAGGDTASSPDDAASPDDDGPASDAGDGATDGTADRTADVDRNDAGDGIAAGVSSADDEGSWLGVVAAGALVVGIGGATLQRRRRQVG